MLLKPKKNIFHWFENSHMNKNSFCELVNKDFTFHVRNCSTLHVPFRPVYEFMKSGKEMVYNKPNTSILKNNNKIENNNLRNCFLFQFSFSYEFQFVFSYTSILWAPCVSIFMSQMTCDNVVPVISPGSFFKMKKKEPIKSYFLSQMGT